MKYMYEQRQQKEAKRKTKICPRDTWNVEYAKQGTRNLQENQITQLLEKKHETRTNG